MKKYQKQLVSLVAGAVLGYLVYYFFLITHYRRSSRPGC